MGFVIAEVDQAGATVAIPNGRWYKQFLKEDNNAERKEEEISRFLRKRTRKMGSRA